MNQSTLATSNEVPIPVYLKNHEPETEQLLDKIELKNEPKIYTPHWIEGGAKHPGLIVETAGLANVSPPPITYRPRLPKSLSDNGILSSFQIERVIYAGQAHGQRLSNSARAGISIGDGTGTGKTSSLAGIVLDNWFHGRRKTVWFSVKADLIEAVREEFERLGFDVPIRIINEYSTDQNILLKEGIIFCTYKSLIAKSKTGNRRVSQIMTWLGTDGLEIFDEGHRAKHAFADDGGKATQTGLAVLETQDPEKYPDIRVVYSSATAASEVRHLAYQVRLGLWGEGTSFPRGFAQFAEEIESGGVGAMEMTARDLKAMGRYFCGNLSFGVDPESGLAVEYREVTHFLTGRQHEMYDSMAKAWQEVLKNFTRALEITNSAKVAGRYIVSQFWAEHQRCFRNLITAFKVPTLIREIENALADKQSIVISITGTGEAQTKKQIGRAIDEEEAIDELDFSPRETLSRLVENCFPTKLFQEETDIHSGTTVWVPVLDETGTQIDSRVALELKKELLDRLSILEVPENPLDQLVNYFGTENVAEMTGRKKRLIRTLSGKLEYRARQIPGVPNRLINLHEKNSFQNKQKRIAIMSEVAATGDSLHSSKKANNQQRRLHIAAELKWSADKQVQDFGRTHRTGQVSPPIYLLLFTELGGEKRFSSTIARRLGNMGALTKGDRRAEKAGNLDKYNLESAEGRAALNVVFSRILNGMEIPGLPDARQTLTDMGLLPTNNNDANFSDIAAKERTNIPRFLNRLLSLEVERQNALFEYFYQTFLETIEHLKAKGKLNDGMEDLKASSVVISEPPQVLHTDALTRANTIYYKLEIKVPTSPALFERISQFDGVYFYENRRTGEFIAARQTLAHTDPETGDRYQMVSVSRPAGYNLAYMRDSELNQNYKLVAKSRVGIWWREEEQKIPPIETKTIHLLSGALLPIWKNLKMLSQAGLNIIRTTTDDGKRIVGVKISTETIGEIRRMFGVRQNVAETTEEIIRVVSRENETIELVGGIKIRKTRYQGISAIEVVPASYDQILELREIGFVNIIQNSRNCFFVPDDEIKAKETLERLFALHIPRQTPKTSANAIFEPNMSQIEPERTPIQLPSWLIEPSNDEIAKILVKT
jgi:P-loop containing NTP hydrolase pore-1/C-terminal domain on Strawberry notch homologue